jgi:hypothetical protein
MVLGTITQIIPAQAVKIFRGGDELILASDVKWRATHVRNITNTRAGPVYTFQWRVREIEALISQTEDLLTQLETDNLLNTRSALTFNNWRIQGLNIGGVVGDDTDDTYSASLLDYEELAPENGEYKVRIKLLVAGTPT